MAKILPFTGNSQKTPEQSRLSAAEAPIIALRILTGDEAVAAMYNLVLRLQMSKAAMQGTQNNLESNQSAQIIDASAQFQAHNVLGFNQPRYGDTDVQKAA